MGLTAWRLRCLAVPSLRSMDHGQTKSYPNEDSRCYSRRFARICYDYHWAFVVLRVEGLRNHLSFALLDSLL